MIVNSLGAEFGYELISIIPFAYYLHTKGELEGTESVPDTHSLYYFSPNHKETILKREWHSYSRQIKQSNIPNKTIHTANLDFSQWIAPPYKEFYGANNLVDSFDVIICNKYTQEWGGSPVNFISVSLLERILKQLRGKRILYNRMTAEIGEHDHQESLDLGEWDLLKSYSNVVTIQTLLEFLNEHYVVQKDSEFEKISYNRVQLWAMAKCNQFISVQGGSGTLCSYFGGRNVVWIQRCNHLASGAYNWYHKISGCNVTATMNEKVLMEKVREYAI